MLHNIHNDNRLSAASLINNLSLVCCADADVSGVDYIFHNETLGYQSYIDHMFISAEYKQCINLGKVVDSGNSQSDHSPVKMLINLNKVEFIANNANHTNNHCFNYVS